MLNKQVKTKTVMIKNFNTKIADKQATRQKWGAFYKETLITTKKANKNGGSINE